MIPVNVSSGPPVVAWTTRSDYDANSNLIYSGYALSVQPPTVLTVSSVSTAAAAVITTSGNHGLASGQTVVISNATGDWAGLNGTQIVTVTGATTFSVPVNSSAFAGTFNGTVVTTAPQTNDTCWAIQKNTFDTNNRLTVSAWAGGNPNPVNSWDNRASLSYS